MHFAIPFFALIASVVAQADVSTSAIAATRLATSHQWVTSADGVKIYAEAIGSPSNPHVILAHGLACTHSAFDPLWNDANLQKSLYMVRYDTRGHGQTDKPATAAGYNSSRYAQDVEAIVKAFSLKRPFFAGWSLAGAIAVDLASYYPPTLAGLPFSGFISFAGLPSMDLIPSVTTDLVRSFVPGLIDSANATNAVQTRINFAGTLSSQQTSVPFDILSQWVGSASYLPPVTANFVLTRTQDNTNFFKVGTAGWPTLILFGDADDQVIPTDVLTVMKPFTKQESHVYPGAGHIVFYDAEPQVAQNLLAFVKKYYSAK